MLRLASLLLVVASVAKPTTQSTWNDRLQLSKSVLEKQLNSNEVFLVVGNWCWHSRDCMRYLHDHHIKYSAQPYEDGPGGMWSYLMAVADKMGGQTKKLPKVFVCGEFIGYKEDIKTMHETGVLDEALRDCEAFRLSR